MTLGKPYKVMPEGVTPKCKIFECAGGMGLAGNGWCSFRGEWDNPDCPLFITEENYEIRYKNKPTTPNRGERSRG